jgi:hypothetical protein
MTKAMLGAYALIDWHNVQDILSPTFHNNPRRELPKALLRLQQQVASVLRSRDAAAAYRVTLRIYHGWHYQYDPTTARLDFETYSTDSTLARRFSGVSFTAGFQFGNELVCGTHRNPLYSTYRGHGHEKGQKMVDTAITSDLLHLCKTRMANIVVVVSDDDDYIPAIFTAEAWGADAILLRGNAVTDISKSDVRSLVAHWN